MNKKIFLKSISTTLIIFLMYSIISSFFIAFNFKLLNLAIDIRSFNLYEYLGYVVYSVIFYSLNGILFVFLFFTLLYYFLVFKKNTKNNSLPLLLFYLILFLITSIIFDSNFTTRMNTFLNSVMSLMLAVLFYISINKTVFNNNI